MRRRTFARLLDRLARHEEEVHVATLALLDRFIAVTPVHAPQSGPKQLQNNGP
jgi:hypothetical protein